VIFLKSQHASQPIFVLSLTSESEDVLTDRTNIAVLRASCLTFSNIQLILPHYSFILNNFIDFGV